MKPDLHAKIDTGSPALLSKTEPDFRAHRQKAQRNPLPRSRGLAGAITAKPEWRMRHIPRR